MSTRLDKAIRYLKRAHATNERNVPRILMEELQPKEHNFGGDWRQLIWTTAANRLDNTFYKDDYGGRNALIRYNIPKDWHREHMVPNPKYSRHQEYFVKGQYGPSSYEQHEFERKHMDTSLGGRVSTYDDVIPNEFIDEICFGPNAEWCYDPDELERHVMVDHSDPEEPFVWDDFFYPRAKDIFEKYGRK